MVYIDAEDDSSWQVAIICRVEENIFGELIPSFDSWIRSHFLTIRGRRGSPSGGDPPIARH